jgi:hypothetical protein
MYTSGVNIVVDYFLSLLILKLVIHWQVPWTEPDTRWPVMASLSPESKQRSLFA